MQHGQQFKQRNTQLTGLYNIVPFTLRKSTYIFTFNALGAISAFALHRFYPQMHLTDTYFVGVQLPIYCHSVYHLYGAFPRLSLILTFIMNRTQGSYVGFILRICIFYYGSVYSKYVGTSSGNSNFLLLVGWPKQYTCTVRHLPSADSVALQ